MYSAKQKSALKELTKSKAHLIRCNPNYLNWTLPENQTKPKLDEIKSPLAGVSWKKNKATDSQIHGHIESGGLLALKPWSLGCAVFDVDEGDGSGVILELGEPAFVCDSRREGGKHLFYKSTAPVRQGKFKHGSDEGETRCNDGYLILWHPEQIDLQALKNSETITYSQKRKTTATAHHKEDDLPSLEKMKEILSKIDPSCGYEQWREVGMALKNTYKGEGFSLWDTWSSQSWKYDAGEMTGKWESFSYEGELTFATILHHARPTECFDKDYCATLLEASQIVEKKFEEETDKINFVDLYDDPDEETEWVVENWLAKGELQLMCGKTSVGKGVVSNWMAAAISNGTPFPDGTPTKKSTVVIYTGEERRKNIVNPRLRNFNADERRIKFIANREKGEEKFEFDPSNEDHMYLLGEALTKIPDIGLIIIDPVMNVVPHGANENSNLDVRNALKPLIDIAEKANICCLAIVHPRKDSSGQLIDHISGASAWTQRARGTFMMDWIEQEGERTRVLTTLETGWNLPGGGPSISYELEKVKINTRFGKNRDAVNITWGEADSRFGEDILAGIDRRTTKEPEKREIAESWLYGKFLLSDMKWNDLEDAAKGIHAKGTLKKARDKMKEKGIIECDRNRTNKWRLVDPEI